MKDTFNALKSVKYLVDANGQKVAVMLSIKAWKTLNNYIESQKDTAIVKPTLNTGEALFEPRPLNSIEFELEEINIHKDCLAS